MQIKNRISCFVVLSVLLLYPSGLVVGQVSVDPQTNKTKTEAAEKTDQPEKAAASLGVTEKDDIKNTENDDEKPAANKKAAKETSKGISLEKGVANNWRVGVKIKAGSQEVKGMMVTLPVPTDWPEQKVSLVEENFPDYIKEVRYRELDNGIKQIVARFGTIKPGELVALSATFHVETMAIKAPADTSIFKIPKGLRGKIKDHLGVSPQINYRNSKFRSHSKSIIKEHTLAWDQVQALHQWVVDNVRQIGGDPQDTLTTLRDKKGCAEDLTCLFIAMCRANKIPARVVWVNGTQHAEFYLVDDEGEGYWFPSQTTGNTEFGSLTMPRLILEKGDNFKVPEKKDRQKFVREFAIGKGKSKPQLRFTRDLLPAKK